MKVFGKVLKKAREAKFRSAQKFAERLGLEPHTYRTYERGKAEPNFETLTRICAELDITPNDLLPAASGRNKAADNPSSHKPAA